MADFPADLQSFRHSVPYLGIDPIFMEPINQFAGISQNTLQNSTLNLQDFMPNFSSNGSPFSLQAPDFPGNWTENFQSIISPGNQQNTVAVSHPIMTEQKKFHESKKRKAMDLSESSSGNSSPRVSGSGIKRRNGSGKGKRGKGNDEKEKQDEEKPKEVVHVRARRGQATDNHSLAERVRRGKINEKLRCLQDIVPGCYKTMGMAVMLDEIINYVQSLQNQVEFLSMKLSAASTYYDFNSETDDIETMQRAKAQEAKEMERLMRGGYGGPSCFTSTWP
ncbi:hypothetical protein SLE2022_296500 [Rubroshorea leprosula]